MTGPSPDTLPAAREAMARHEWEQARDLFLAAEQTRPLTPPDLELLAEADGWTGHGEEQVDRLQRAYAAYMAQEEPAGAAWNALQLAEVSMQRQARHVAAGWLRRADRLLADLPPTRAHARMGIIQVSRAVLQGDVPAALESAERVLALARSLGDRETEVLAINMKGRALIKNGQVDEGLELIDEAAAAAVGGELTAASTGDVYCSTIDACRDLADWQRAAEWTEEADRELRRQRITGYPGVCRVHRAEIKRIRGDWPEAEEEAKQACRELEAVNVFIIAGWGYYELGEVRLRMGDLDGAEAAFAKALEYGRDPEPGMALLRLARGDTAAAAASIQRALSASERPAYLTGDSPIDPLGRTHLLPAQVEIALAAGDPETARAAADELASAADRYGSLAIKASAAHAAGSVQLAQGDATAAVGSFAQAVRLWHQVRAPYETARSREGLAAAYRASGDEGACHLEMEAARTTYDRLKAMPDLQRVERALDKDLASASRAGERQVKTFMFTDMVSSTDLIEAIGDVAWDELNQWHDTTLRSLFARHGGQEISHAGDGFFVAFDAARPAIEAAIDVQRSLAAHRTKHGFAPWVRIGLHTAEASRSGGIYRGMGVHAAARVSALADSDQILVSTDTLNAAGPLDIPVSDERSVTLKGIREPMSVVSLGWQLSA